MIEKETKRPVNLSSGRKISLIKACKILNKKYVNKEVLFDLKRGRDIYGDNALLKRLGIKKFKNVNQSLLSYRR